MSISFLLSVSAPTMQNCVPLQNVLRIPFYTVFQKTVLQNMFRNIPRKPALLSEQPLKKYIKYKNNRFVYKRRPLCLCSIFQEHLSKQIKYKKIIKQLRLHVEFHSLHFLTSMNSSYMFIIHWVFHIFILIPLSKHNFPI